jgi:hypothetical protein
MKANELKELIRPLIAEEVQKQLPKLLFEMLGSQSKTVVRESVTPSKQEVFPTNRKPPQQQYQQPAVQQKKPIKKFVKDPILNQILNETTPGLPQTPYGSSIVDLDSGGFEKIGGMSEEFRTEMRTLMGEGINSEEIVNETQPLPNVQNLFNKDFKSILNKSKEKGGGGNSFSGIIQNW